MITLVKEAKHTYIKNDRRIRRGEPIISGTGIRVLDIAIRYEIMGMSPEDILVAFPFLRLYTDENVDIRIAEGLRSRGVDVFTAKEIGLIVTSDIEHLNYAFQTMV